MKECKNCKYFYVQTAIARVDEEMKTVELERCALTSQETRSIKKCNSFKKGEIEEC